MAAGARTGTGLGELIVLTRHGSVARAQRCCNFLFGWHTVRGAWTRPRSWPRPRPGTAEG